MSSDAIGICTGQESCRTGNCSECLQISEALFKGFEQSARCPRTLELSKGNVITGIIALRLPVVEEVLYEAEKKPGAAVSSMGDGGGSGLSTISHHPENGQSSPTLVC